MLSLSRTARHLSRTPLTLPHCRLHPAYYPSRRVSRFQGRKPIGSGRERPGNFVRPNSKQRESAETEHRHEQEPSAHESALWQTASQRATVTGDPEEGLRRLLMDNEVLVVERQIEMLNVFMGFEQTNKYSISNEAGEPLGFIAEEPRGFIASISRQLLRTHRPFRALVMDANGSPILWLRRPFAFINSRMFVQRLKDYSTYTPEGEPVLDTFAEVQQRWHLWRRRYDLFLRDSPRRILSLASESQPEPDLTEDYFSQMARVDSGFLAWNFSVQDAQGQELGHIGREFRGFGREVFTDTGRYFVRFGPRPYMDPDTPGLLRQPKLDIDLTMDQRALMLSLAVNLDFDFFSRHSEGGHGLGFGLWGMSSE